MSDTNKTRVSIYKLDISEYKTRIRPYDNYGFLEGAYLVV